MPSSPCKQRAASDLPDGGATIVAARPWVKRDWTAAGGCGRIEAFGHRRQE
jgi:hypothetical protein